MEQNPYKSPPEIDDEPPRRWGWWFDAMLFVVMIGSILLVLHPGFQWWIVHGIHE